MTRHRPVAMCLASALLLGSAPAQAHLMPPGTGTLRLDADGLFLVAALPVSALSGFDANGDGLMGIDELQARRVELVAQADRLIIIRTDDAPGRTSFADLIFPHADDGRAAPTTHLVLMRRTRLSSTEGRIRVRLEPPRGRSFGPLELVAMHGDGRQVVRLDDHRREARLFAGPPLWRRLTERLRRWWTK